MSIANIKNIVFLSSFLVVLLLFSASPVIAGDCAYFFYGNGCPHCANAEPVVKQLTDAGADIRYFEVYQNSSNALLLNDFFEANKIPREQRGVPALFYAGGYLLGDKPIIDNAAKAVNANGNAPCPSPNENVSGVTAPQSVSTFKTMSFTELLVFISGAAIVDSINPCAIAVLLILLSALLAAGDARRALKAGVAFIAAVYIAYYLFGVGLFSALQFTGLNDLFYRLVGFLAILVGLLNIKDYLWYGGGGFVMEIPRSWRPTMKSLLRSVTSVPGAFVMGFAVCLFELPCTGGPYFFTLGLLAGQMTLAEILPILAFYNLLFVAPLLLIVLALNYGWVTVEKTEALKEQNLRRLHLAAGIIMLALGIATVLRLF